MSTLGIRSANDKAAPPPPASLSPPPSPASSSPDRTLGPLVGGGGVSPAL